MSDTQALTTTFESNHIDLAIAGWLDAHSPGLRLGGAETRKRKQDNRAIGEVEGLAAVHFRGIGSRYYSVARCNFVTFVGCDHSAHSHKMICDRMAAILTGFFCLLYGRLKVTFFLLVQFAS